MADPNQLDDPTENPNKDELNNPATNKAVDEIMASDSDAVLEAEDEKKLAETFSGKKAPALQRVKDKLKDWFKIWWNTPKYRWGSLIGLGLLLIVLLSIPPSRYFMLNSVGIRSSASLTVLDEKTAQPLKNVTVHLSNQSGQTDNEGNVKLNHLKLGSTNLVIERRAFAKIEQRLTVGWGSNPLGEFKLTPTGSQYAFRVVDFLSDKPIAKAEAISGVFSAFSDEEGKILLTIEETESEEIKVNLVADTYRTEELTFNAGVKDEQQLKLAPGRKSVFVSKRSGKYELYKIDVDGKNEEKLLAGTGHEQSDMTLSVHPTEETLAYVSTRDNKRNKDGYLLQQLYLIDVKTGTTHLLTSSERIQIVDWIGDRLVYVKIAEGTSGASPGRHRLVSFDFKTESSKELASANYFNDVLTAAAAVYYAPSAAYQADSLLGLFKVNADGTSKQTIISGEVWNVFHTEYSQLNISAASGDWYSYKIGDSSPSKMSGPPGTLRPRLYINNPEASQSLWIDERDGKGVLIAYDVGAKTDKVLKTQTGLNNPVRWLNNRYVIFRIASGQEIADYVMNLDGGEAKKIKDVTNTGGIDSWYYY